MKTRHMGGALSAVGSALLIASVGAAQTITVTVTDKGGNPRPNITGEYTVVGIEVSPGQYVRQVPLIENKEFVTGGEGLFDIPVPEDVLRDISSLLHGSKQVRLILKSRGFSPVQIDFLCGDKSQELAVVMRAVPVPRAKRIDVCCKRRRCRLWGHRCRLFRWRCR